MKGALKGKAFRVVLELSEDEAHALESDLQELLASRDYHQLDAAQFDQAQNLHDLLVRLRFLVLC